MTVMGEQVRFVLLSIFPFCRLTSNCPRPVQAFEMAKGCCDEEMLVHFNHQVLNKQRNYH